MKMFLVLALFTVSAFAEEILITSPKGGWRDTSGKKIKYSQEVHYPDVKVSTPEDQPDSGLIEGKILGADKGHKKPYTLVINGNAMPLKVEDGSFQRPYSFGTGANSLKIISPDGKAESKVQFYDVNKTGFPARIRVSLSWDVDQTDIDLHVVTPDGGHCYYGNRKLENGSALDVDVTTGYGPEIFSSPGSSKGTYLVYVNYYGRASDTDIITATVNVIINEGTLDEKVETVRVPLRNPGELTFVHSFKHF
jgi:uncharacterized protein YfaP (DUF2135 family)